MNDLTISIINYKTAQLTAKCIRSILEKKWNVKFEIIMIDNASGDDSVAVLKKEFPKLKLIESSENGGFAKGHNLVLKDISSRYALILNSDTEVLENTLDEMVEFMDQHKKVGVASCKIVGYDDILQPNAGDFPFGFSLINWLFNLEMFGIKKPAFHIDESSYYSEAKQVDWISGSFMIIRKEVLDTVGSLNDDYFMYFEDTEFCYRVRKAGFEVMINPAVAIKHLSGGSSENPHLRQWVGEYKGLLRFYKDQFGFLAALGVKGLIYIATMLRVLAFTIIGKPKYAQTYVEVIRQIT